MSKPTDSFLKVPYDLRPSKQVERKMMIDVFRILLRAGYRINDYKYTGFGSIFFVDFIMFHKMLGINRMLSVEHAPKAKTRCKFNRPFRNIDIHFGPASEIIPELDRDLQHLLWLDYDDLMDREILADISTAASQLSRGSILITTIDVEPPQIEDIPDAGPHEWFEYFQEFAGSYFSATWTSENFAKSELPFRNVEIVEQAIRTALAGRTIINFLPVFSFLYSDGHLMLTVGGIIGDDSDKRRLASCDFSSCPFVRLSLSDAPYNIKIPILTRKERVKLDTLMPPEGTWNQKRYSISGVDLSDYPDIYKYLPNYAELLWD